MTESSRQPSKFLTGTAIPNSTIKGEALVAAAARKPEDKNVIREKRDASVREVKYLNCFLVIFDYFDVQTNVKSISIDN